MTATDITSREAVTLQFVERLALMLNESGGLPRMAARVLAYVLADDAERYTAAELAAGLRVSPAAISGAVRHLVRLGYLAKEHLPGERSDSYRIFDEDVWGTITHQQERILEAYERLGAEGAEALGPDTPGGRRMRETKEFYAFMRAETPGLIARWREHRRTLGLIGG